MEDLIFASKLVWMSEFFKYTGESIIKSPNILIRRRDIIAIQDICVKSLGYRNINAVRDRYDGQRFMDNQIRKIGSLYALCDYFDLTKPVLSEVLIANTNPLIEIAGKKYQILTSDFGTLPSANNLTANYDVIVTCRRDDVYFLIIGVLPKTKINDESYFKTNAVGKTFIGFKSLQDLPSK